MDRDTVYCDECGKEIDIWDAIRLNRGRVNYCKKCYKKIKIKKEIKKMGKWNHMRGRNEKQVWKHNKTKLKISIDIRKSKYTPIDTWAVYVNNDYKKQLIFSYDIAPGRIGWYEKAQKRLNENIDIFKKRTKDLKTQKSIFEQAKKYRMK